MRAAHPADPGVLPIGVPRLMDVLQLDDQRGVVGRLLALAGVAVDERPAHALGERSRAEHQVDAHADALVEVAGPVVPPGEEPVRVGVAGAEHVGEAPVEQALQRVPAPARSRGSRRRSSAGSQTSRSAGAMLKSPHSATGAAGSATASRWPTSRSSQRSLYW